MKKLTLIAVAMLAASQMSHARLLPTSVEVNNPPACMVADPTGTLLNVRETPAGKRLGSLNNGTRIKLTHVEEDHKGRTWAYAKWSDKKQPLANAKTKRFEGWVIREYVSCRL